MLKVNVPLSTMINSACRRSDDFKVVIGVNYDVASYSGLSKSILSQYMHLIIMMLPHIWVCPSLYYPNICITTIRGSLNSTTSFKGMGTLNGHGQAKLQFSSPMVKFLVFHMINQKKSVHLDPRTLMIW